MTGFSQGGFMTWRFLCAHADLFASVAPPRPVELPGRRQPVGRPGLLVHRCGGPSRKVPILYMHGRADDNYIPFACAQPQVDAIVSAWGLTAEGVVASSPTYTRTRWSDATGTVVELVVHDYSSSAQVRSSRRPGCTGTAFRARPTQATTRQLFSFRCQQPASFVWGAEVVDFFVAHPR